MLICRLLLWCRGERTKSSIGTFALRLVASALLFAPAAAQAQGSSHSVCRDVWDGGTKYVRVCDNVYYPPPAPPPPPAPEPPVRHTPASETIQYDPVAEARKAQLRATASPIGFNFVPVTLPDDRFGRLPKITRLGVPPSPYGIRRKGVEGIRPYD